MSTAPEGCVCMMQYTTSGGLEPVLVPQCPVHGASLGKEEELRGRLAELTKAFEARCATKEREYWIEVLGGLMEKVSARRSVTKADIYSNGAVLGALRALRKKMIERNEANK